MLRTSMGQLLINEALPEDMRDYDRTLDKKGMNTLLRELAQKHPEKYPEVSKKLNDIGRTVATEFGGYTFGLEHLRKSKVGKRYEQELRAKVKQILDNDRLTPQERKDLIVKTVGAAQQKQIDEIYDEAVKENNPLALQVVSGSRGNKMNLGSLLGSDMLYADHRDEVIPLPVLSSYSQGLKPVEYWASTYGARRGTMATKFATQDAGFLSKQLNQVAHRLMVVDEDDPRDLPHRGLPVDTDDGDNEGSLLAHDVGPYKRNTVLSPKILKHIKGLGHDRILVRSPLVGGSPDGGVYSRDVGVRERGVLPGRGEQVGLTAAQALSEPLSQGQLSAKHSGGVAGQEKAVGGFAYINQLIQTPKKGKGWASQSEHDGRVTEIQPAPAGGSYVFVGDNRHYVPANLALKVKKGDEVEAGDVLSEGFPNPSVVTRFKGVGEGKRYFVNAMRQAMTDAGMKCNRRNVELLARGLINHVRLTDEYGDHVPDDVVPYSTMEHLYEPREGHEVVPAQRALGKFLEKPVLHYSIGTKVRPSVLKELQHFGVGEVTVHNDPPPFEAEMIRGMASLRHDPDWMTRMYGSGLKDSLLDATHHGAVSDEQGTSFVPGLARAVDFGRTGTVRAPEKGITPPPEGQPLGDPRRSPAPPKPPSPQLTMPQLNQPAEQPKKKGFFSGLFKMSEDDMEMEKEAATAKQIMGVKPAKQVRVAAGKVKQVMNIRQTKLTKVAAAPPKPKVDTTMPGSTGSSTAAPLTASAPPPGVAPPPAAGGPTPGVTPGPAPSPGIMPAATAAPPAPPAGPPAVPPSPPGEVNPARVPFELKSNPWSEGVGTPAPQTPGMNPDAFSEGYVPGRGMMAPGDDPNIMAAFVQGGGRQDDPASGFGGQFGAVTRFGSLMDQNATAALTSGTDYVPNAQRHGGYHDDLIGGPSPSIMPDGPMGWNNVLDKPMSRAEASAPPPAPAQQPQAAAPAFSQQSYASRYGWKAGGQDFDATRTAVAKARGVAPEAVPEADVHSEMWAASKFNVAAQKAGYEPGKPQFEKLRAELKAATNADVSDDAVMGAVYDRKLVDPAGVHDYVVHDALVQSGRSPGEQAARAIVNPAEAASTAAGVSVAARGARSLVGLPAKGGVFGGLAKPFGKILAPVGAAVQVADAVNMTKDEALGRYDAKMKGQVDTKLPFGLGEVKGNTLGGVLLDNAINPGQNIRAMTEATREGFAQQAQEKARGVGLDVTRVAQATEKMNFLADVAKRRQLQPDEKQQLDDAIKTVQTVSRANAGNKDFDDPRGTKKWVAAIGQQGNRDRLGEASAEKYFEGTASPAEGEAFLAWMDSQRQPRVFYGPPTPESHAYDDARVARLRQVATLAESKGDKEAAKIALQGIAAIGETPLARTKMWEEKTPEFLRKQQQDPFGSSAPPRSPTAPAFNSALPSLGGGVFNPSGGFTLPKPNNNELPGLD